MIFKCTLFQKLILILLVLNFSFKLRSQQKVYFKQEIGKFEENQKFYHGKKVKDVLKDLKVDIEFAILGGGSVEESNFISLRFDNKKDYNQLQEKGIDPARLTLFIKESDSKTNKLFYSEERKTIDRDHLKNKSNIKILKDYANFTIIMIEANSQQPKTKANLK